jgi:hypothetical protein
MGVRFSIGVYGTNGNVYFGANGGTISIVDDGSGANPSDEEIVAQINGAGCPGGKLSRNPAIAVDQSNGHVLAFDNEFGTAREYEASGACVTEFGSFTTALSRPERIAVDNSCALHEPPLSETTTPTCAQFNPSNGNAYIAFDDTKANTPDLWAFAPLSYGGEPPLAITAAATGLGSGNATLNGSVNPNGEVLLECKFEYLRETEYEQNIDDEVDPFLGAAEEDCAETAIGSGKEPVAVHADITGLDPERYRFRLVARNKSGRSDGDASLFGPPLATTKTAQPVFYDEATLRGEVDPSGLATEYHFEYGTAAGEYDHSTPVAQLPAGDGPVAVQAVLVGLQEGVEYYFRLVAENEAGEAFGAEQSFRALKRPDGDPCPNDQFRTGLGANLPDCRAYELVTPAETSGFTPHAAGNGSPGAGFTNWLVTPRGAGAGESLAYFSNGTLPGFDGNGFLDGYRARRGPGEHPPEGWSSEIFSPSYPEAVPGFDNVLSQQGVAADQLYSFWRIDPEETFPQTLAAGIYLRTPEGIADTQCTTPGHQPGRYELVGCGRLGADPDAQSRFLSPGGAHVIFASAKELETGAAPAPAVAIYDRAAGASSATVISVKPQDLDEDGKGDPFAAGESATYIASSEDGTATLFKVGGVLYLHRGAQSTEIAASPNTFAGLSRDGTRVFYAAAASGDAPATLRACDLEAAGPCSASPARVEIAANSIFLNVSADGSKVFFSSKDAIPGTTANENGETALPGERNLYEWDWTTKATSFIARLHPDDFVLAGFGAIPGMNLARWTAAVNPGGSGPAHSPARSTPDGGVLVFQSHAQLTSYDNEAGGKRHGEIYRYEPAAAPGGRLLCVSCDPTGAPPSADAMLQDIRTGTNVDATTVIPNLVDAGTEVFFQSPDRLLPEDANSVVDVYEWQAEGEDCETGEGCLGLISSGQGEQPSFLFSMSADGQDVFFTTREKLVGADVPGSPSIYDARVGGGIPEQLIVGECQGDACQGQGSAPPALPAPVSTAPGDGNVKDTRPRRCPKGKRKVKRAGKVKCVKRHGRKQSGKGSRRPAGNERKAQR